MGKTADQSRPTTLYDHIRELQMRLFVVIVALVIAGAVIYAYYQPILALLSSPLNAPLYYSSPAGGFGFIMKICFTGALIIAIPVLAYNLIMFVRPAFKQYLPMKRVFLTAAFTTILAIAGAAFAFYCILPGTLSFFKGFQVSGLSALISADNYLGFVTNIIITFVIVFQIPLVIAFIDRIKPLQPKKLIKFEKWVVIGSLVVALLAPFTYDLITSLLIALPIIVLYNLSIIMVVMRHANVARKARLASQSTIIEPSFNFEATPELVVNDQIFETIADELVDFDEPVPVPAFIPIPAPVQIATTQKPTILVTAMDIRPTGKREEVKPAAWVLERKLKRELLMEQARRFSEIHRDAKVKRVATS